MYVARNLKNNKDLSDWARSQGITGLLDADDMHVTIAYSTERVDWDRTTPYIDTVRVTSGNRSLQKFGEDGGTVVLCFESDDLSRRWEEFREDVGCSWSHPAYRPHVSLSYDGKSTDIDGIAPYSGPLVFGPEKFAEVDPDYKKKTASRDQEQITVARTK